MIPELEARKDEIAEACRRHSVRRLEIFGSAAVGGFEPARSDYDFLVEFDEVPEGKYADAYFGFGERLEEILGRPVDLVVASAIKNRVFLRTVERTKQLLYAA